jgi:hypothetical protein
MVKKMASPAGLEPATPSLGNLCSIHTELQGPILLAFYQSESFA